MVGAFRCPTRPFDPDRGGQAVCERACRIVASTAGDRTVHGQSAVEEQLLTKSDLLCGLRVVSRNRGSRQRSGNADLTRRLRPCEAARFGYRWRLLGIRSGQRVEDVSDHSRAYRFTTNRPLRQRRTQHALSASRRHSLNSHIWILTTPQPPLLPGVFFLSMDTDNRTPTRFHFGYSKARRSDAVWRARHIPCPSVQRFLDQQLPEGILGREYPEQSTVGARLQSDTDDASGTVTGKKRKELVPRNASF